MPSDERIELALSALSAHTKSFQAALANTIEQIRNFRASHGLATDDKVSRLEQELGPFAADLIDGDKFSALFADSVKLDALTLETIDKALETLTELVARGDKMFIVDVAPGEHLRDRVGAALEDLGRAFGAARVFEMSRFGHFPDNEHARSLGSFPFQRWSRGERRMAPPLVVSVDGADLRAAGLAEFMDGFEKLVLVVRSESTPVPLVRLITPGAFVQQTGDAADVSKLAAWNGPGVAALVPDSAARFVHDPGAGSDAGARLSVQSMPEERRRKPVGGVSVSQQSEELEQLKALAGQVGAKKEAEPVAATATAAADPVDKLAAWLLSQADLKNIG